MFDLSRVDTGEGALRRLEPSGLRSLYSTETFGVVFNFRAGATRQWPRTQRRWTRPFSCPVMFAARDIFCFRVPRLPYRQAQADVRGATCNHAGRQCFASPLSPS